MSRPAGRSSWGLPVPGDKSQTVYVWLDALVNYYTVLGYPQTAPTKSTGEDTTFHSITHVLGKDILRFHALVWPGMLLAAGYPTPKGLVVHNFWLKDNVS